MRQDQHAIVLELARLPQTMRGYGHVKESNIDAARAREAYLLAQLNEPAGAERPDVRRERIAS